MSKVEVLLRRLEKIHKDLGGNMADANVDTKDKYATLRFEIEELLHKIEATQEERKRALELHNQ